MRVVEAGVVGAGAMGAAIAELLAFNGIPVHLKEVDETRLRSGLDRIRGLVKELVQFHERRAGEEIARIEGIGLTLSEVQREAIRFRYRPKVSRGQGEEIVERIHGTVDWKPFERADLVIEAVFEREEVKRSVLESLDRVLPDHAVIGTNTSSLSITRLARGLRHAPSTLATHFFNPPTTLPLVEVAAGVETREEVVSEAIDFFQGLRNHRYPMVPIRVKESPGFLVNRILLPVLNEACSALQEGLAPARDIDLAMKTGAGLPMGPFELADLIGLDLALEVSSTLVRETGDPKYRPPPLLRRLVDAGHLGRKAGRGFYEYP
ncbi:MAG: 3-hydroxyacyl-CoA dehydrogenase family protein [Thermoplasmata archaeon]|nr:3-hydroxyacyl-CoA dehydrogenase family protein [Thermoplasmata archaeon]MCI4358894.1 3-hydroxyacyl-CoA dehydrogenase family protein [Thermoplasmata archaeon]